MLLSDPMLVGEIENTIANEGVNSEYAIEQMCIRDRGTSGSVGIGILDSLAEKPFTDTI